MRNLEPLEDEIYDAQEPLSQDKALEARKRVPKHGHVSSPTDARIIKGVLDRFMTCTQCQPKMPPIARANVNDGTLYMPGLR